MADGSGISAEGSELTTKDLGTKIKDQEKSPPPHSHFEDLKSLGLDSFGKFSAIATDGNFLGEGGNASVFAIPDNDKYVVKIGHQAWTKQEEGELIPVDDPFPDINVGQAVAKAGSAYVLLRQEGVPAGITNLDIKRLGLSHELANADYLRRTTLASDMPQEAYDELAKLLKILNERRYDFDPSKPNNILIDAKKQRFNLVDLNPREPNSNYENNFSSIIIPLMNNSYAWKVEDPDIEQALIPKRAIILDKATRAGIKIGLPIPPEDDSSLIYSFKLAGKEGQWPTQRQTMVSANSTGK